MDIADHSGIGFAAVARWEKIQHRSNPVPREVSQRVYMNIMHLVKLYLGDVLVSRDSGARCNSAIYINYSHMAGDSPDSKGG